MVYLKSVENVITLGKLIGLLFLFCLPLLSILFFKTKRNDLARPVMGIIFLVTFWQILKPHTYYLYMLLMEVPIKPKKLLMLFPSMHKSPPPPWAFRGNGNSTCQCRLTDTSQELLDSWSVTVAQPVVVTVLMTALMS